MKRKFFILLTIIFLVTSMFLSFKNYQLYLKIADLQRKILDLQSNKNEYQKNIQKVDEFWRKLTKIEENKLIPRTVNVKTWDYIHVYQFFVFYLAKKFESYELVKLENFHPKILKVSFKIDESDLESLGHEIESFPLFSKVIYDQKPKNKGTKLVKCTVYLK